MEYDLLNIPDEVERQVGICVSVETQVKENNPRPQFLLHCSKGGSEQPAYDRFLSLADSDQQH